MAFTKAKIEVIDEDQPPQNWPGRAIDVQVNPSEYTLTKGAQIAEIGIPGIDSPVLQFIRGQNEKLTLDLFFDTTRSGMGESPVVDVTTMTDQIYQLVKIQPETHAPPRIRFIWGEGLTFQAIVESIQRKFTVFNPAGIPLRATLTVTFREYKTLEQQLTELNLQSSDQSKSVVTQRGDTLSGLAFREYRDPGAWRAIADANRSVLPDPRRLEPGIVLLIPPLERGRPVVGR
jgi:Contractile injection system tube protein/LysM domain